MSSRWCRAGLALIFILLSLASPLQSFAGDPYDPLVETLLSRLTTEQRIGQLIMVTFRGPNLDTDTRITRLIQDYHIGGVMLLAANDNIDGHGNTAANVQTLVNDLQSLNYNATLSVDQRPILAYVPLFVATSHEGDTIATMQIGTTPLPTNMALGATWNPDHARDTGAIAGQELSAMGINLLLGPSLDVIQSPSMEASIQILGTRTFGGQPWWVGQMARAYIQGVHEGSAGRIAVVPGHFPGLGSSDRDPTLEIPVVPRTADELRRIDLVPFFDVTGQVNNPLEKADGLQCTSIRYQGSNIRTIMRPTCIDEQSSMDVMRMNDLGTWRSDGGMVISESLGTRAIRRWYDAIPFPHRQIARDALLAGNDILTLSDFGPYTGADDLDNITDVIDFFTALYQSDPVVHARVDQAVRRILKQKLEIYSGVLSLDNVKRRLNALTIIGRNVSDLYAIARDAVTLIAPSRQRLAPPPIPGDNITIFTDERYMQQCSTCTSQPVIPSDGLERALVRLYGPLASGQVDPSRIHSYSFVQLAETLNTPSGTQDAPAEIKTVRTVLDESDWIIFAMLDETPNVPDSDVVQQFLDARPDLTNRTRVVVMAFGAPTYLSSTDISKLSAYYGIYGTSAAFIDASARALFQEVSYQGRPPISIPGVNYDLQAATSPDPGQTIYIVPEQPNTVSTPTPPIMPTTTVGTLLALRTEPILDRNGHTVPDGTPVVFTLSFVTEGVQRTQETTTVNGIARTSFTLTRPGQVQIRAASLDATTSVTFQVIVSENALAATMRTIEPPTLTATPSPSNTSTATATETYTATVPPTATATASFTVVPTARPTATPTPTPIPAVARVGPRDFVAAILGLLLISLIGFAVGWASIRTMDAGLHVLLSCVIGGLIGYIYYASGLLGADFFRINLRDVGALVVTVGTGLSGLLAGWISIRRKFPTRSR